jgi:exodeoxyribonuclease V alpha subunit
MATLTHHLDGFLENLAAGIYVGLVDEAEAPGGAPLVHVRGREGGRHPDLLYFQRFFMHERRLQARVDNFLDREAAPLCAADRIDTLIGTLWRSERVIRPGTDRLPLSADPWQQAALRLALRRPFAVISGGPGTGKTSLMVNILRLLTDCGIEAGDIRLSAPTGRAAQRMHEALQHFIPGIDVPTDRERRLLEIEPTTLHRLLGFDPHQQGVRYHAEHPLPARVVIVDEVSMIDVGMLDRLLQAVDPHHTRLILLGDKDQLPSVQAGAVFAEMVPPPAAEISDEQRGGKGASHRFQDHLVILKNSYRSGRRLLELGAAVNAGRMPEMTSCSMAEALDLPPDSYACVNPPSANGSHDGLEKGLEPLFAAWVDQHYANDAEGGPSYFELAATWSDRSSLTPEAAGPPEILRGLFDRLNRARVLSVARRGLQGCVSLNRWMVTYLAGRFGQATDPATGLFNGIPILITRNDYARRLFNGDVGVALRDASGGLRVYVQRGIRVVSAPIQALSHWEPAFATTVHKSQGSEFGNVLLVFPGDPDHRLLSREIFYTAVTRARERLLLLAHPEEMTAALSRRIQRSSGLTWSR